MTVTATSVQDTTKTGNTTVTVTTSTTTITSVSVSCNPSTVQTGGTSKCTATVTGTGSYSSAVNWSVAGVQGGNSTVGTISSSGLYTAPSTVPNPNTVTVTAASVADPTQSASATVTITATSGTGSVTLSTNSLSFGSQAFQTASPAQTILVTSSGTGPLAISSIAVSGGNRADFLQFNNCPGSAGALSAGAICTINVTFSPSTTAGESATLTITDNASGSPQTVQLSGQGVGQAVTIAPTATTVETNQSVPFIANVVGLSSTAVTWSATAGSISAAGLYTAPAGAPTSNTATVTATSQSDPSLSASATVTITPPAVSVLVSPTSASVQAGGSEVVTAVVADTSNTAVMWSVNGVASGNSAVGTIATSGGTTNVATYTAPSNLPSTNPVTITATSNADPSKSDSASITITSGPGIVITSLDKTSLQPFNLLTITGAGFNPQATVTVNFSDSTGYSMNVPPVSIGANSVVVGVPPYISVSSGEFAAGSVNIQVSQTFGGSTVTSNTLSGFQIPNLPTLTTQPGAVTLALLTAQNQFCQFLINYFSQVNPTSSLNTPEMNGALNVLASGLSPLITEMSDVVQNPTHTFTLGVASGITLTVGSSELAKADQMIVGVLSAQAAAGFVDGPEPNCEAGGWAQSVVDTTIRSGQGEQVDVNSAQGRMVTCAVPYAVLTGVGIMGAAAGVTTAGAGLLFGPATAMASAAISLQIAYITTVLGGGLTLVGGALGTGSAYGKALVQAGASIINDYLIGLAKSFIVSTTFGETAGNVYDLAVSVNELVHAGECAPPFSCGPSVGPTSTLTVNPTGTGTGTIESYPGGLVCGGPDSTVCVVPFPTGETVYLDSESASGSSFNGFSGACSGSACEVTMSTDQAVTANFNPASSSGEGVSTTNLSLGSVGGCGGGQISGTFQVLAPAGDSWDAFVDLNEFVGQTSSISPTSGTGPGTLTVTINIAPQTPGPESTCQSTMPEAGDLLVGVVFPYSINSFSVNVTFTFIFVDTE